MPFVLVWLLFAPTLKIDLVPQFARPGSPILISAPGLAGSSIDVRYRFRDHGPGQFLNFCTLDSDGRGVTSVPADMPNGIVEITAVRISGTTEWQPAEGWVQIKALTWWTRMPLFLQWWLRIAAWLAGLSLAWLLAERFRRFREMRTRLAASVRLPARLEPQRARLCSAWNKGRAAWYQKRNAALAARAADPTPRLATPAHFASWEWVLIALAIAIICYQILLPPPIGLADNRDSAKIAGHFSLGAEQAVEDPKHEEFFDYFTTRYVYDYDRYHWDSGIVSSETLLTHVAIWLRRLLSKDGVFDIRYLGVVHATLFIAAFVLLLLLLRPHPKACRIGVPLFVLFVFTDVSYTAYYNSFYMDAGSFAFLLLAIALALRLTKAMDTAWLLLFGAAAALLVACKTQHALLAPALVLFLARIFLAADTRFKRWSAATIALVVAGVAVWTIQIMPAPYKAQPLFNEIFFDEMRNTSDPAGDLKELGLGPDDLRYVGTHSFVPGSPAANWEWATAFVRRTGYGKLLQFYVRHPSRALAKARRFSPALAEIRPPGLANFRKVDGYQPRKRSQAFSVWSDAKSAFFKNYPLTKLITCFTLLLCGGIVVALRSRLSLRRLAPVDVLFLVLLMASIEYLFACYADCLDNGRHLFIFQALVDVALSLAAAAAALGASWLWSRSGPAVRFVVALTSREKQRAAHA